MPFDNLSPLNSAQICPHPKPIPNWSQETFPNLPHPKSTSNLFQKHCQNVSSHLGDQQLGDHDYEMKKKKATMMKTRNHN